MNITIKLSKKDDLSTREKKINIGIRDYSTKLCAIAKEKCNIEQRSCINGEYARIFIERPMKEILDDCYDGLFTFVIDNEVVDRTIKEATEYSRSK